MDLIVALWQRNLIHALESIALQLDFFALANCEKVSQEWKVIFDGLDAKKLKRQEGGTRIRTFQVGCDEDFVTCCDVNEDRLVAGLHDGWVL